MMTMDIKKYSELILLPTFEERFNYLKLTGSIGANTFGFDRYINQNFYRSQEWKQLRDFIILRDSGRDLGMEGYEIYGRVTIHHMNPITVSDITDNTEFLMNPDFLICTTHRTHNAIHYGNSNNLELGPIERKPNDTCPWRK